MTILLLRKPGPWSPLGAAWSSAGPCDNRAQHCRGRRAATTCHLCKSVDFNPARSKKKKTRNMGVSENSVPLLTQWFCWSLSRFLMAISLGILTQHFQVETHIRCKRSQKPNLSFKSLFWPFGENANFSAVQRAWKVIWVNTRLEVETGLSGKWLVSLLGDKWPL